IQPLPYANPDRHVWVAVDFLRDHFEASLAPDFADWHERTRSFQEMTGYLDVGKTVQDGAECTKNAFVDITPDFWRMAGVHAALGRLFSDKDSGVLVPTWKIFQQHFGGDSSANTRQGLSQRTSAA